jgi:hypothetical protein
MLEPSMKKTWKCWLGTVAAAMLGTSMMAQAQEVTGPGPAFEPETEGAVVVGPGTGSGIETPQFPRLEPIDPDAVWEGAPRAYQGAPPPQDANVGFATAASFADVQYRLGRVNIDQYGFDGGYTSFGAFIPLATDSQNMWFFDPRASVSDYGKGIANLGLGYRYYNPEMQRVFGVSGWFDYDTGHRDNYSQAGLSLESLGRYFSLRANANVPLNDGIDITTGATVGNPFFQGNNIAYLYTFLRELSYQNYTIEAATPVPYFGRYGWEWAVGGYALVANREGGQDAAGVSGRFEWQIVKDFWMNSVVTHDRVFGTNASVNFELTIPSGRPGKWLRPLRVQDRLNASVKRPYRVSASVNTIAENRLFVDPCDGDPLVVAHIIPPTSGVATAVGGDGSIDDPFLSVAAYMASLDRDDNDIIFVRRNENRASDVNLNTTIDISGKQRLLGDGLGTLTFATINPLTGAEVNVLLPGQGIVDGTRPFMTNSGDPAGGDVITIVGNSTAVEVNNFNIDGGSSPIGNGVVTAAGDFADSFLIRNNRFTNVPNGIVLNVDTTGDSAHCDLEDIGVIQNNTLVGDPLLSDRAISVNLVDGNLNLLVADNTITDFTAGASPGGIFITADGPGSSIDANNTTPEQGILRNTITGSGSGIVLTATNGATQAIDLQDNTVNGSTDAAGAGLIATADGAGSLIVFDTFEDNIFNGGAGSGAILTATGTAILGTNNSIVRSQFNNNDIDGFQAIASGASDIQIQGFGSTATGSGNQFNGNGDDGLEIDVSGTSTFTVVDAVINNSFNGNGDDGLVGTASGPGSNIRMVIGDPTTGSILGNTMTGNGLISGDGSGIDLTATAGATLDTPILNNDVSNNAGNGIQYTLNATTEDQIFMQGNLIDNSGLGGVVITSTDTPIDEIFFDGNQAINSQNGDGLLLDLTNSPTTLVTVSNNALTANNGNGVNFDLDNSPIETLQILNNTGGITQALSFNVSISSIHWESENLTPGLFLTQLSYDFGATPYAFDGQDLIYYFNGVQTGLATINGSPVNLGVGPQPGLVPAGTTTLTVGYTDFDSADPRPHFDVTLADAGGTGTVTSGLDLGGATVTATFSNGATLMGVLADGTTNHTFAQAAVAGGISGNTLDGVRLNATNGSDIGTLNVDNNTIDGNTANGVNIIAVDSLLPAPGANPIRITNNTIQNNGIDGVRMINPSTGGNPVGIDFINNTINTNTEHGVHVEVNNGSGGVVSNFRSNTITGNGNIAAAANDIDPFTSGGIRFVGAETATVDLNIGGPLAADANTINGNIGPNIALFLEDDSVGNIAIQGGTADGATGATGNGVQISVIEQATLNTINIIDTSLSGNEANGLRVLVTGTGVINNALVTGSTLNDNDADNNNVGDGISVLRLGSGQINNFQIIDNEITGNFDGIDLAARGRDEPPADSYVIVDNILEDNEDDGISMHVVGDADIDAIIDGNSILRNGGNGIETSETVNTGGDTRSIDLQVTDNDINFNGLNGVAVFAAHTQLGDAGVLDRVVIQGNRINDNGTAGIQDMGNGIVIGLPPGNGIAIDDDGLIRGGGGPGDELIDGNEIVRNFGSGVSINKIGTGGNGDVETIINNIISNNGEDGIEIAQTLGISGGMTVNVVSNTIEFNGEDGVEITNSNVVNGVQNGIMFVNLDQNLIASNQDRGVAIFNMGDADGSFNLTGNRIESNLDEGVYLVYTASVTQDTDADATAALVADGNVEATGNVLFNMTNNQILDNGAGSAFDGTGLVLRIGTSDGGIDDYEDEGGFADTRAGVIANVNDNIFAGARGADFYAESFASTLDPATTVSSDGWEDQNDNPRNAANDDFDVDRYFTDPLARMDLTMRNNSFLEISATNVGAFYDNTEAVFKSRTQNQDGNDPPGPGGDDNGPFSNATGGNRERNAQRLAGRFDLPPGLVIGDSEDFLFPGMGESTFRVNSDVNTANTFTFGNLPFIFDADPYVDQFSANGIIRGGTGQAFLDRMPYGWGTLP